MIIELVQGVTGEVARNIVSAVDVVVDESRPVAELDEIVDERHERRLAILALHAFGPLFDVLAGVQEAFDPTTSGLVNLFLAGFNLSQHATSEEALLQPATDVRPI